MATLCYEETASQNTMWLILKRECDVNVMIMIIMIIIIYFAIRQVKICNMRASRYSKTATLIAGIKL